MVTKEVCYPDKVRVTFTMPAGIWADTIHLVGDFNNWSKNATPLRLSEHGWNVSLELEAGNAYQYRYLINGTDWYNDWRADRYVPNELGGDNSVVITSVPHQEARPGWVIGQANNNGRSVSHPPLSPQWTSGSAAMVCAESVF